MSETIWSLSPQQAFEAAECSLLVFHNVYPEGKQGGLELIQHGERVATNGDLRLEATPGQWAPLPAVQRRTAAGGEVRVELAFPEPSLRYTVRVWAEGERIELAVDLEQPLEEAWEGKAGFNLELLPDGLAGKTFFMDEDIGVFPEQSNGPVRLGASGQPQPEPLARGRRLVAAPDDPYRRLAVISHGEADLALYDGRDTSHNGWFVLRTLVPTGASREAVRWTIIPNRVAGWRSAPQILVSQVGYHPDQEKQVLIELDPRVEAAALEEATLVRLQPDGPGEVVRKGRPEMLGRFWGRGYARFDITGERRPGLYVITYGAIRSQPFAIRGDVYKNVWQPTLETFLPVQMCHVKVEDRERVWHGACHLDDALQAPVNHEHFDGYRQYAETETSFAPFEHIPWLDRGGWHDAGDYDLAAGSQASTTFYLALARETFGLDSDQTTVRRGERLVQLHLPDGVPDAVQQVTHGVENLLSGYRAAGHSFAGIIESTLKQYTHLGDAATMTDNRVYTGEGPRDDRWAFTNHNTALEYQVAAALAAAARVLRGYEDELACECLETALRVWENEHSREADTRPNVYIWNDPLATEVLAAVELMITTGEERFAGRLLELLPVIGEKFDRLGWAAARGLAWLQERGKAPEAFATRLRQAAEEYRRDLQAEMDASPFRLPFGKGWLRANLPDHDPFAGDYYAPIWGVGWSLQHFAVGYYFLAAAFPDLFDREPLLRVLNYVLGWHPAGSQSLVSGVGARSLTVAYGTNRAEGSYIPGGVVSGPALIRPGFIELLDPFPWLWQQKEYVIGGSATYIFLALAADKMLNGQRATPR